MLPQYWAHPSGRNTPWYQHITMVTHTLLYNNLSLPIADRHQSIVNSHHLHSCTEQFSTAGIVTCTDSHRQDVVYLQAYQNYSAPPSLEWNSACRPPFNATSHIEQQKQSERARNSQLWMVVCLGSMQIPYLIGGFHLEYIKNTIVHSGKQTLILNFLPSTCCKLYFLKIRIDDQFLTRLSLKSHFSLVLVYPSSGPNPVYSESYSNNSKGETTSSVNRKIVWHTYQSVYFPVNSYCLWKSCFSNYTSNSNFLTLYPLQLHFTAHKN